MESLNIEIQDSQKRVWNILPEAYRTSIASKALNALLDGRIYPSGSEKIELAIDLAAAGMDAETISLLTHLEKEVFENFMTK